MQLVAGYVIMDFLQWLHAARPSLASLKGFPDKELIELAGQFVRERGMPFDTAAWQDSLNELVHSNSRKDYPKPEGGSDVFTRYLRVPLHAIFLYTSQDKVVGQYLLDHWETLDRQTGDFCDLHTSERQLQNQEDAYSLIDNLHLPANSICPPQSMFPGMYFWTIKGEYDYISFGNDPTEAELTAKLRSILGTLRERPLIATVQALKQTLHQEPASEDQFDPEYDFTGMPWHDPVIPDMDSVGFDDLTSAEAADVLLITATSKELQQVLHLLQPLTTRSHIVKIHKGLETYYVGRFGAFNSALIRCDAGTVGPTAATLTANAALELWHPKTVVMVGIAFGADRKTQQPADVLIAEDIVPYEAQRVGEKKIFRAAIPPAGPTLLNRFKNALGWKFVRPDDTLVEVHFGRVLSGDKLVDDPLFKKELIEEFPEAIGGEMEGAGLYAAAARSKTEWILVKAVCDWADGKKHKKFQQMAAAAAASLVCFVMSDSHALDGLVSQRFDQPQGGRGRATGNGTPLSKQDVYRAATTLMQQHGQTTTLDVKLWLREQGFHAIQATVSALMRELSDVNNWKTRTNGTFITYSVRSASGSKEQS